MNRRVLGVVVVLAALAAGLWWWRRSSAPAEVAPPAARGGDHTAAPPPAGTATAATATGRLRGVVRDGRGPLAGAVIRLAPGADQGDGEVVVLRAGTDGGFHAEALAPGGWLVSGSAPSHSPRAKAVTLVADREATLELVLDDGGRALAGVVTDATGGPIAGARVDAAALGASVRASDDVASTTTGADGRYVLTVTEGQLEVGVADPDYAPVARVVDVGPTGATADFAMLPGGVIEGVVIRDGDRAPVAGAQVTAGRDGAAIALAEAGTTRAATAGADGRFRITGLPPGSYDLAAKRDALISRGPTTIGLGVADQRTDLTLVVGAGPTIRGVVVDETGAPVGARVLVEHDGESEESPTDPAGRFTLIGVAPGQLTLTALREGSLDALPVAFVFTTKDVSDLKLVLRRGVTLRGHVEPRQVTEVALDLSRPLGEAPRHLPPPVTTDASGAFTFAALVPAPATLTGRTAAGEQGTLTVTVGDDGPEVVLHLVTGASLAGKVVDAAGKPLAGVSVAASNLGAVERTTMVNGRITSGIQALTSATGSYDLRGLAAGPYKLTVLDRGRPLSPHGANALPRVTLAAAEHKDGVDLIVERATGVISGVVVDASGTPIADAWVSVHQGLDELLGLRGGPGGPGGLGGPSGPHPGPPPPGGGSEDGDGQMQTMEIDAVGNGAAAFTPVLTDGHGHFEVGGLPAGRYEVTAEAQAGRVRGMLHDVAAGTTVRVTAQALTELVGTVTAAAGPATLFTVELDGPSQARETFADPAGAFRFPRVDPGAYMVRVHGSAGNGEAKLTVVAGQRAEVAITLVANGAVIGTLVDGEGAPLAGIGVALVPDHGDGNLRFVQHGPPPKSGDDGRFRVEGAAGTMFFIALAPGGIAMRPGLEVKAGETLDLGKFPLTTGGKGPGPGGSGGPRGAGGGGPAPRAP